MNKDIKILFENQDYLYITWEKDELANEYIIFGTNQLFNNDLIWTTDNNFAMFDKKFICNYLSIQIKYIRKDVNIVQDLVLGESNPLDLTKTKYNKISINFIKSYNGITLSFESNGIYDKYYLYEKIGDNYYIIADTEDFQYTSDRIVEGNTYYVEGLIKTSNKYQKRGMSIDHVCKLKNHTKPTDIKISIVIPVYNSELFISRCIDSILASTFKDLEILLIDDGATDNTPKIIDWYQENYKGTVKAFHKENEGVSITRSFGIQEALGEYTGFVDNDDMVHPYMYEKLYNAAKKEKSNIAIAKTYIRNDINNHNICLNVPNENNEEYRVYDYKEMQKLKNKNSRENIYFVAVWNKIIKTTIVKKHKFYNKNYYEDTAYTRMIYSYLDKFVFVYGAYYVWEKRQRKTVGSASTLNYKNISDDPNIIHKLFLDAILYGIDKGNPKRKEYIIYDSLLEIKGYIEKTFKNTPKTDKAYKIYIDRVKELNNKHDLLNNIYIKKDKEMVKLLKDLLKTK